jgi:hypothetical protein
MLSRALSLNSEASCPASSNIRRKGSLVRSVLLRSTANMRRNIRSFKISRSMADIASNGEPFSSAALFSLGGVKVSSFLDKRSQDSQNQSTHVQFNPHGSGKVFQSNIRAT